MCRLCVARSEHACLVQVAHEENALQGLHTERCQSANPVVRLKVEDRGHWVHNSLEGIVKHLQQSTWYVLFTDLYVVIMCLKVQWETGKILVSKYCFWILFEWQLNSRADSKEPAL